MTAPRRVGCMLVFAAALAWPTVALAGPPWGTDDSSFQATYLQPGDLPSPSDLSGDWARAGCEPDAAQAGCTHWGKKLPPFRVRADASVVRAAGIPVATVAGDERAAKVTVAHDLQIAEMQVER